MSAEQQTTGQKRARGRPRQGPAVARHLPRDKEIMKIASQVFLDRGVEGATLEHIASAAGIAKASIYYYFDSKEELLRRVIEDVFNAVQQDETPTRDAPPEVQIGEIIRMRIELALNNPVEHELLLRQYRNATEIGEWFVEYRRRAAEKVQRVVKAGQAAGTFRDEDPRLLTAFVLGAIYAAVSDYYRPRDVPIEQLVEFTTDSVLRAIGTENIGSGSRGSGRADVSAGSRSGRRSRPAGA